MKVVTFTTSILDFGGLNYVNLPRTSKWHEHLHDILMCCILTNATYGKGSSGPHHHVGMTWSWEGKGFDTDAWTFPAFRAVMCIDVGLQTEDERLQLLSKQCTENYIENLQGAAGGQAAVGVICASCLPLVVTQSPIVADFLSGFQPA